MPRYTGVRLGLDPTEGSPNWILDAPATKNGSLRSIIISGERGNSERCRIRVNRASGQTGTGDTTGAPVAKWGLAAVPANGIRFYSGFPGGANPTLVAGAIAARALNLHGGVISWNFASNEIQLVGAASPSGDTTVACINDSGFGERARATHTIMWEEA
jgi:hypothetical protein